MPKIKAAIYCRVSTDKQFDKGGSLETQEERCRDYCKKNDYKGWDPFDGLNAKIFSSNVV